MILKTLATIVIHIKWKIIFLKLQIFYQYVTVKYKTNKTLINHEMIRSKNIIFLKKNPYFQQPKYRSDHLSSFIRETFSLQQMALNVKPHSWSMCRKQKGKVFRPIRLSCLTPRLRDLHRREGRKNVRARGYKWLQGNSVL